MRRWLPVLLAASLAGAARADPAPIDMHLCVDASRAMTPAREKWQLATLSSLVRFLGLYVQKGVRFNPFIDEACTQPPSFGCEARKGQLFCSFYSLTRIAVAQAFAAAAQARVASSTKAFTAPGPIGGDRALELSDYHLRGQTLEQTAELMKSEKAGALTFEDVLVIPGTVAKLSAQITTSVQKELGKRKDIMFLGDPEVTTAYVLYEGAFGSLVAYILGHELAHAMGTCLFQERARVERSGLLAKLVALQDEGQVLCPKPIETRELQAETCALRAVRAWDTLTHLQRGAVHGSTARARMESVSRRTAIDTLAFLLALGLHTTTSDILAKARPRWGEGSPVSVYASRYPDGYLYSPIRLVLFVDELREFDEYPWVTGLCDGTASEFALMLAGATAGCWEERGRPRTTTADGVQIVEVDKARFVEPFGDFVPARLKEYWSGRGDLDRTAFRCSQPDPTPAPPAR